MDVEASAVHYDGAETDSENLGPEECSTEFFDFLMHLKVHGKLSAKDVCILSCWARGASVQGEGANLAVKPSRTASARSSTHCWASPKPFKVISVTCQSMECHAVPYGAMPRRERVRRLGPGNR